MKAGEKLKYKARRYLYQLEQNINNNNQKKQLEVQQNQKNKQFHVEDKKEHYNTQKEELEYYDLYLDHKGYNTHKFSDQNNYNEYPTHNEYYKPKQKKNNSILGALDEIEEYLQEKMDKFKK